MHASYPQDRTRGEEVFDGFCGTEKARRHDQIRSSPIPNTGI